MAKKKRRKRVPNMAMEDMTRQRHVPPTGNGVGGDKNVTLYRPEYCAEARQLGALGWSEAMMAMEFGVRRSAMRGWGKKFPEFGEALEDAREFALAWWERKGQRSLHRRDFNTPLYNKLIACRFRQDYADRLLHAGDSDAPVIHEIRRTIVRAGA